MQLKVLPDQFVDVNQDEGGDHDLEDISRKVMMQEQGPIVEEKWKKMEEVTSQKNFTSRNKFLEEF